MIDIIPANQKVGKHFDDPDYKNLLKKIGLEFTRATKRRIKQIKSFSCFYKYYESKLGKPERMSGTDSDKYSIHISGNYRLIVKPLTEGYDKESLMKCESIIIEGVVDYHGDKNNWLIP